MSSERPPKNISQESKHHKDQSQDDSSLSSTLDRRAMIGAIGALSAHVVLSGCGADQNTTSGEMGAGSGGGSAGEPVAGEPIAGEPIAGEPIAGEPVAGEPIAGEPIAGEPIAGEPIAGEPIAGEPIAGEPIAGEPIAGEALPEVCLSTPGQIEGPFYFGVDERADLSAGQEGVLVTLEITVVDAECNPIPDALVEIWHADARGVYSGFINQGVDTTGESFLRGETTSDASGVTRFKTIYPGWYPGRAVHVHFKVSVNDNVQLTSQLYFPDDISRTVYQEGAYAERGEQDTTNQADSFLNRVDQVDLLIAQVTPDDAGGYEARLSVTITG